MRGHFSLRGNPTSRRSSGFTLVELIISIVLIGILAVVGSSMIVDSFATARMVNADSASAGLARYALERLAREIREVKYAGSGATGSYCITMAATNLVFKKPVSGSTDVTDCNTEVITVTISYGNPDLTLQYSSPAATSTLSDQVSSFSLSYIPDPVDATLTTGTIRFVVIQLTVTDATSGQSVSQRTRVALRNA